MRLILTVLVLVFLFASSSVASAIELPASVLKPLNADVSSNSARLKVERTKLLTLIKKQHSFEHDVALLDNKERLVFGASSLIPGFSHIATPLKGAKDRAQNKVDESIIKVNLQTDNAAQQQARLFDAQRRLNAIKRAASADPAEVIDDVIGYRFAGKHELVSAKSIDTYLESKASPMAGSGAAILNAGIKNRIDPRFIIAIAGAESYFGLETCAAHNAWGWGCPNSPASFSSWDIAAQTIASGLRKKYLNDGLNTVGKIHLRYAPPNADNDPTGLNFAWPDNVARFLMEQGGDPQQLEGPINSSR